MAQPAPNPRHQSGNVTHGSLEAWQIMIPAAPRHPNGHLRRRGISSYLAGLPVNSLLVWPFYALLGLSLDLGVARRRHRRCVSSSVSRSCSGISRSSSPSARSRVNPSMSVFILYDRDMPITVFSRGFGGHGLQGSKLLSLLFTAPAQVLAKVVLPRYVEDQEAKETYYCFGEFRVRPQWEQFFSELR